MLFQLEERISQIQVVHAQILAKDRMLRFDLQGSLLMSNGLFQDRAAFCQLPPALHESKAVWTIAGTGIHSSPHHFAPAVANAGRRNGTPLPPDRPAPGRPGRDR